MADALGRVRVRFPWDRGPERKRGEPDISPFLRGDNTCWVRVSEGWAGRHYGHQFLPRIGQEVIVDFLAGDPDRPIITGRVYNADYDTHSNRPFVDDDLANENLKTIQDLRKKESTKWFFSGIKTRSIPLKDTDKPRFHLLRFNDNKDKEQYLIRSQRRLDITAFEKRYESIGSDRHLTVGKVGGTQSSSSGGGDGGSYLAKVVNDYHLSVGKARNTLVKKDDSLQVNGSSSEMVGGNWSVTVGGPAAASAISAGASVGSGASPAEAAEAAADAAAAAAALAMPSQATIDVPGPLGTIVLNSGFNISLSVGTSSIVLTPAAIFITAMAINLNGPVLGAPPVPPPVPFPPLPPKDAGAVKPKEPTPADPGDDLKPPPEPS